MSILGSDIYQIQNYVNDLKKENINEDENTLAMGIYGYLGDSFSHLIQNNVIVASEYINEMFPTRVKYEKSILDHAMFYNVSEINAVPSTIQVTICLLESEVENNLKDNKLVIDKNHSIYMGEYEFHLEYDIILTRSVLLDNGIMYTARYDNERKNPISKIKSTYLTTPYRQLLNGYRYIFITCQLRQVTYSEIFKKIITSNMISNKSLEFEFGDQLAAFDIKVTRGNESFPITPILQGSTSVGIDGYYCFYRYLDSSNIRIFFDSESFIPKLNDEITIFVQTTKGTEGDFEYVDDIITSFSSDKYGYSNLPTLIKPLSDSQYGEDKVTIDELKKIVPREALSRGSITMMQDLNNYFNTINTDNNKLTFYKKADNQFERLYYSYLLIKDSEGMIVPTNTINLSLLYRNSLNVMDTDFDSISENRAIIRPGTHFRLTKNDIGGWYAEKEAPDSVYYFENEEDYTSENDFIYTSPFLIIVNLRPLLYTSYYLTILNKKYSLLTSSTEINDESELHFIALSADWKRKYKQNNYKLKFQCTQNINEYRGLILKDELGEPILDEEGNFKDRKIRSILLIDNGKAFVEGNLTNYTEENGLFAYEFEFELVTNDFIDIKNNIEIPNIHSAQYAPITDISISKVNLNSLISIANGEYVLFESDDISASWTKVVDNETFTIEYIGEEDSDSLDGSAYLDIDPITNFVIDDLESSITTPPKNINVVKITESFSIPLNKGIGEYVVKLENMSPDNIIWEREVDGEIYTVTYDKLTTSCTMKMHTELDFSHATISDIKIPDSEEFSSSITVTGLYNNTPIRESESEYSLITDDSIKTVWSYNSGMDSYFVTQYKKEKRWLLEKSDEEILNIEEIVSDSSSITISHVFDEERNYIHEAEGVYIQELDNETETVWKRNVNGNVYRATYNKTVLENKWSLVGPGNTNYPEFNYKTYASPTVSILSVTDRHGDRVETAEGVYVLLESTPEFDIWRLEGVDKNYTLTLKKVDSEYTLESFTNYSEFDIDQTTNISFPSETPMKIYILYEDQSGVSYGTMDLNKYIPTSYPEPLDNYTVSNIYNVGNNDGKVEFFFNYTDIISSKTTVNQETIEEGHFYQYMHLDSVPMFRAAYIDEDDSKIEDVIDVMETKRGYIENAMDVLEDQFGIDFKFYNTYGPSRIFYIDNELLDRVDIKLEFEVALKAGGNKSNIELIKNDIKGYIENLNNTENNLHISNIITPITNKYITDTLNYIEFYKINNYSTEKQFLSRTPTSELSVDTPPEFINIHYIYKKDEVENKMVNNGIGITINTAE